MGGGLSRFLKSLTEAIVGTFKGKSLEYVEVELRELENVFALIVMGSFIGLPSPPMTISLKLLPHMGRELIIASRVSERLDDMLGEMAGLFEVS